MIRVVFAMFAVILLAIAGGTLLGCERIESGNTGIEVGWTGKVEDKALPQGIYSTAFKTIYEVSGKEDTIQLNDLHPKSKDNLTMEDMDIDITVQIDPSKAPSIYTRFSNDLHLHKEIGAYVVGTNYVTRQARAVIFQVVANHEAITMHQIRVTLENEISQRLQEELNHDMGKDWIMVRNVNIRNLVTDKNVEESIRKIAATQFATRAAIEGQKQAEAEAIKLLITQEGQAKAAAAQRLIEAEATAKSNDMITKSVTPEVLEYRRIEAMREFANKGANTVLLPAGTTSLSPILNVGK